MLTGSGCVPLVVMATSTDETQHLCWWWPGAHWDFCRDLKYIHCSNIDIFVISPLKYTDADEGGTESSDDEEGYENVAEVHEQFRYTTSTILRGESRGVWR